MIQFNGSGLGLDTPAKDISNFRITLDKYIQETLADNTLPVFAVDAMFYDSPDIMDHDDKLGKADKEDLAKAESLQKGVKRCNPKELVDVSIRINARRRAARDISIAVCGRKRMFLSGLNTNRIGDRLLKERLESEE